ncbi:hypothetical protein BDN72DRAFT_904873 [Pluteus cervinus]|uniref:Uncharacterized protein n=1 Tax=Pluteus cervinus TaxID=181527 RepID=A0ACD3A4L0_9AGAR|nr:hypothetical protein BDN72DRAFT_904873 [Pluteus cervinus]
MSIAHALVVADTIREKITHAASDPRNLAKTPEDAHAGRLAKQKAEEALTTTIATVKNTLDLMKATTPKPPARAAKIPQPSTLKDHRAALTAVRSFVAAADPASGPQAVVDGMKADNLKAGKQSLQDMAIAIEPIVAKFDSISIATYLDQYSATLNTVPVVGVKNNQLLYIQTKNHLTSGLVDEWSTFSSLPPDTTIKEGDIVHIFPYKGDFCFAIGKTVWKKVHLSNDDPKIQNAVDNWPALYSSEWTALGDCLPTANLTGVVPFSVLSADRKQIDFQLVTLAVDGSISWLTSDQLTPQSKWETMEYKAASGGPTISPKFTKIAYWNNNIVGIDDASNSWNISVSFQNGTFNVSDQRHISSVTEFTATDAGPVGLRTDGYLWKRIIAPSPNGDSGKDPVLDWQRWIKADGVVNIGVASPGVILDMRLLTRTLKSRYLDVQTAVYPVVEKIKGFCTTHEVFLDNVAQAAQDYANADADEKRTLAINNAKSFVTHSKTWGGIVSKSIKSCQQSVTVMTAQLHDVRVQLEAQLKLLYMKLTMLQATLKSQEERLSELKAAFWGFIGMAILGLALVVVGAVTGLPVMMAGGLLMVGGIVAAIAINSKINKLADDIANTKLQIETVNNAIAEMTNIVNAFSDLDSLYGTLNQFWGRISNDASNVKTMDDATAELIGAEILEDLSSIQASRQVTGEMGTACTTYLDTLNKQGIVIPDSLDVANAVSTFTKLARAAGAISHPGGNNLAAVFEAAQAALKQGNVGDYHQIMTHATLLHMSASLEQLFANADPKIWFDLPALHASSNIWISASQNFTKSAGVLDAPQILGPFNEQVTVSANDLDSSLDQARSSVTQSLQSIIGMGNTIVTWAEQFPDPPTDPADIEKLNAYRDQAVKACGDAQHQAASANNSFVDFNHKAADYQQNLETQVNVNNNAIVAANAKCDQDIHDLSPPWHVVLGGFLTILYWTENQRKSICDDRDNAVNRINAQIAALRALESSGVTFNGHVITWTEMVQTISGKLGLIHNTLVGVWGQLLEDPSLYHSFLQQEWAQLVQSATDVLAILNNSKTPVALWAVPRQTALIASLEVHPVPHAVLAAAPPPPSPTQRVVSAVTPSNQLGDTIASQAEQATAFFTELDVLLKLPFMKDIIGYWNDDKTQKQTLYDVTVSLRSDYVNMIALEYNAVQSLQNLALLQDFRAGNVVNGRLPIKTFVQSTLTSIRAAAKASTTVNDKFKDSAKDFAAILRIINTNIITVEQQISDLNDRIGDAEKAERDKIISIIADAIAIAFTSAVLLASFGVIGPAAAALDLAVQIGAGATSVASGVTAVLDTMSPSDLIKLIQSLKATRTVLQESIDQLKKVQPLFSDVVSGVSILNTTVQDMQDVLVNVQSDVDLGSIAFTQEDAEGVQVAWQKIRDDTQTWLDTVNRQGIVPQWAT